jgi:hemerythrin superfamily protein
MEISMADAHDAIALLKVDHRKVEDLFAKFEAAREADKKQRLAKQICTELTVHTILEEEIFYPACEGEIEDGLVSEGYVEHDAAKVLIAELEAGSPDQEFYDAKVKVLSEQIEHHVHEEEKRSEGIFAQARAAGLDMDALGARMLSRKQELMAQIEADGLPSPETRTFTGHDLEMSLPLDEAEAEEKA